MDTLIKHAREAFGSRERIDAEWRELNFTAPPDLAKAIDDYEAFVDALRRLGSEPKFLPAASGTSIDSIYVRDAAVMSPAGAILCHMGKPQRRGEPSAQEAYFRAHGVHVLGSIEAPGTLEGGDVTWLDSHTVAVGRGYRTNDEGIRQLRVLLGRTVNHFIVVPLPHWRGPGDVFHLMSIISPVDRDLAVVYSPLLPVPFRELLLERGYTLVEVPDEEFDSMGANVFGVRARRCLMVAGNPKTRAGLERAGAHVIEYDGTEISIKGGGGPTCLTRPMREWY